ncbi:uncharacterized protein JCM6883_002085 [Sporobolomyces salmoneus]|uniref:uncharacterized protein n=1 Tax=Sporobolomyces salmoneus TaxID=183962 RepID=UPI003173007C
MSSIALFLVAKCSHRRGSYFSMLSQCKRLRNVTSSLWSETEGFNELEDSGKVEEAVKAFLNEQDSVSIQELKSETRKALDISQVESSSSNNDAFKDDSDANWDEAFNSSVAESISGFNELVVSSTSVQGVGCVQSSAATSSIGVVPNLPQVGDRFSSTKQLFIATYKALVPVYGHGVNLDESKDGVTAWLRCGRNNSARRHHLQDRCAWKVGAAINPSTGEAVVEQALSHLVHNHGPSPRILKNPDYRPVVINPIIREAFGLTPIDLNRRRKKITSENPGQSQPLKKKLKDSESETFENETPPQTNKQFYPLRTSHPTEAMKPSSSSPSFLLPVPPSSDFILQLESFLKGLDPSLSSLAAPLLAAGIDSFDTLVLFSSLEPLTIDLFLESVQVKARESNQSISGDRLELFGKLVKEAKEGQHNA